MFGIPEAILTIHYTTFYGPTMTIRGRLYWGGARFSEPGVQVEWPQATRGVGYEQGVSPSPLGGGVWVKGRAPSPENFFNFFLQNGAF